MSAAVPVPVPVLTRSSVLSLNPCSEWRDRGIDRYLAGRESVPLDEVLLDADRRRISEADQRWLVAQLLDRALAYRWMHVFVERAIRRSLGRTGCHEWEEWAARWLSGDDRTAEAARAAEEGVASADAAAAWAARAAAWAASADAAAAWAARVAAWAARVAAWAWAARAEDAAAWAVEAAAWAAWAAAARAEGANEHRTQMQDAIRLLGGA